MRLISWNVNGLRACLKKGFNEFFDTIDAVTTQHVNLLWRHCMMARAGDEAIHPRTWLFDSTDSCPALASTLNEPIIESIFFSDC
jgi:hypothetical protein